MEVSNSILSGDEYLGQPEEVVRQYIRKISISMLHVLAVLYLSKLEVGYG